MAAADLLAECEAAISACFKSQAYTVGERQQQRAQLDRLMAARRMLADEVSAGSGGGSMAQLCQVDQPAQSGAGNWSWRYSSNV